MSSGWRYLAEQGLGKSLVLQAFVRAAVTLVRADLWTASCSCHPVDGAFAEQATFKAPVLQALCERHFDCLTLVLADLRVTAFGRKLA
jgi:hypothetical protein